MKKLYKESAEKLRDFRIAQKLKQKDFAQKLGIASSTLGYVEQGSREITDKIKLALIKVYGYDIDEDKYIQPSLDEAERVSDNLISIPFFRVSAAAGSGVQLDEHQECSRLVFDKRYLKSILPVSVDLDYLQCITASGDSMWTPDNKGINDRDILFIDTKNRIPDNGVYVILVNNELRVKRLLKRLDETIAIKSDNPKYETEIYNPETSPYTISILGKVVFNISNGNV